MHEICRAILPNDLVFDIGGNIGDKTAMYRARGARVVVVEPQPALVARLNERFGGDDMVTIVPMGVSDAPGALPMSINTEVPAISTFSETWKEGRFRDLVWDGRIEIEVTTLDALIARFGAPRFIKIDVEGFEAKVLTGYTRRAGIVSVEYTAEFLPLVESALTILSARGYRSFNFSKGDNDNLELSDWVDHAAMMDLLRSYALEYSLAFGDVYAN